MPIKTLGSLGKIRVDREIGNTHFFAKVRRFCSDLVDARADMCIGLSGFSVDTCTN